MTLNRQMPIGSTSIDVENDFILNSHVLTKLRKELKVKINLKTDSNQKESALGEIRTNSKTNRKLKTIVVNLSTEQRETWGQVLKYLVTDYYQLENVAWKE